MAFAFLWSSILISSTLAAGIQYCQSDPEFCFAVTQKHNESTSDEDLYLTLSTTPSKNGGWFSVGLGNEMKDSLMFIIYADQDSESLVTSFRTADGHSMPKVFLESEVTEQIAVLEATASEDNYLAQFACYGCWSPELYEGGISPYIYAGNTEQTFLSADKYTNLDMHSYSGVIWGDMKLAELADDAEDPAPSIQGDKTIGFTRDAPKAAKSPEGFFTAVRVHGIIMTFSFMGLFVAGSVTIRLPLLRSFKYHWVIQLSASILALGSGLYMFMRSKSFGVHKILGLIVICSLIIQAAAGYKHHIDFVRIRRQTIFTLVHRWLGRAILLFGTFNVGLGMYFRDWSLLGMLGWFLIWSAEIAGYGYVLLQHERRKRATRGQSVPKDDFDDIADAEVFDIGDDFEDDEDDVEGIPLMERPGRNETK
jgi:Cytochrome domain of cellobiose dehydrogenase